MDKNFRLCNDLKELETTLKTIKSDDLELLLWQNINHDKMIVHAYLQDFQVKNKNFYKRQS